MKSSHRQSSPDLITARAKSVASPALQYSLLRFLAHCYGGRWLDHEALARRLRWQAAVAARRGDQGARDFLADLRHEQAA